MNEPDEENFLNLGYLVRCSKNPLKALSRRPENLLSCLRVEFPQQRVPRLSAVRIQHCWLYEVESRSSS